MGILSVLTSIENGPYRYRAGPNTLGVGVENLALVQPGIADSWNFNSPRYNVRNQMDLRLPTLPNPGVKVPNYDLRADGVYLSGQYTLTGLVEPIEGATENG